MGVGTWVYICSTSLCVNRISELTHPLQWQVGDIRSSPRTSYKVVPDTNMEQLLPALGTCEASPEHLLTVFDRRASASAPLINRPKNLHPPVARRKN